LSPEGTVTKDGTKTINGTPAIGLVDSGAQSGTLWVATSGPAYPLLVEAKDPKNGSLAFSEFGEPVTATAPPASQIVDLGKIGGCPGPVRRDPAREHPPTRCAARWPAMSRCRP